VIFYYFPCAVSTKMAIVEEEIILVFLCFHGGIFDVSNSRSTCATNIRFVGRKCRG
jgi:hypothetical protein